MLERMYHGCLIVTNDAHDLHEVFRDGVKLGDSETLAAAIQIAKTTLGGDVDEGDAEAEYEDVT